MKWMRDHNGQSFVRLGYKTTVTREQDPKTGGPVIGMSMVVLDGLKRRGLVEQIGTHGFAYVFKLTVP